MTWLVCLLHFPFDQQGRVQPSLRQQPDGRSLMNDWKYLKVNNKGWRVFVGGANKIIFFIFETIKLCYHVHLAPTLWLSLIHSCLPHVLTPQNQAAARSQEL